MEGDVDLAALGSILSDRSRCKILLALGDGRALPATTLADEAGVAASTASEHLARLVEARLISLERHGRHRYYRIDRPEVGELIEHLARLAPPMEVRSLREGTRAHALRAARTCYDHVAGRLGVGIMSSMIEHGLLRGGNGRFAPASPGRDRPASPGFDLDYHLTRKGMAVLEGLGVEVAPRGRRPLIRYCVDWSEQRHHLAGALGASLAARLFELGWLRRSGSGRALLITPEGTAGLADTFGLDTDAVMG